MSADLIFGLLLGFVIAVKVIAWLAVKAGGIVAGWFINWDRRRPDQNAS